MGTDHVVRLGIVGAGGICRQRHIPGLRGIEGVELVAVCNRSEASSRAAADEFGFREIETDWRRLIERDDVDAVLIGTWPYLHRDIAIAALEAGKHVFCQARMAMDLAEARDMVAAAEARPHLVNMICPPPHRMPWEPYVRDLLDRDELGDLYQVRVVSINAQDLGELTWRQRVEYSGKQALQLGIWAETLNAWLGDYESLVATADIPIPEKPDDDGRPYAIQIPQVIHVSGKLSSGVSIGETHSGVAAHTNVNFVAIYGSNGTLRVDAMTRIFFGRPGEPLQGAEVPDHLKRDWRVERDFIDAVRAARRGEPPERRPVSPDFREGLGYMLKVEAVHESARTGRAVRLSEL